jgi:2-keto-3-deoxy-L-fuconate dehydrogenase
MTDRLKGKKALVTAAAAGIGRATAQAFAREGAQVIATDIDGDGLALLAKEDPRVETRLLDVTDGDAILATVAAAGTLDVLFNCAGFVDQGTILDCAEEVFDFSFDLNVRGMYRMIRAVLPAMTEAGGGSIINMSSVAGSMTGVPGRFAYCATKAAVVGMTRSVAADFVTKGIRCNAICPGTIRSPSWEARVNSAPDPKAALKNFIARQPMGRIGEPEEVAALCVYLASDEAAYTTGAVHVIDGGWTM